jgi:hypothetical protein
MSGKHGTALLAASNRQERSMCEFGSEFEKEEVKAEKVIGQPSVRLDEIG